MKFIALRRQLCVAAALLGTVAGASAQSNEVRIGFIGPTKSLVGKQLVQGAQLAVDFVNSEGGILGGRKVQMVVYDTNFQANEGVASTQRLLTQDGVKVIVGEISSTVALATLQLARASNAVFISAVPKHPDLTKSGYDKVFRLNSTTEMDSKFVQELKADGNVKKVAVIAENSDLGRVTIDGMKSILGSRVVMADTYEMTQSEFSTLVTKAKASGADTVCLAGSNMEQWGNILRLLDELKVNARRCVLPGFLNSRGVQIGGKGAEGSFSADIYVTSLDNALNQRFVKAYEAKYKEAPEKIEALGFESIWLAAQAMKKAGTADDTSKIAKALHAESWETPRGRLSFDATGQASNGGLLPLVVKNGKMIVDKR
ncbi:MAG: ABC transporter substrate-binding protein [Ottowia sp.]|uniref:ABC transporter substrate-binding protein n=1 Tax=unclassified Ottowia TaxID=2645081 RepID=UPI003C2CBA98